MPSAGLLLLALGLATPAAAIDVDLKYPAPPAVAVEVGPVTLQWVDGREPERGGKEPQRVGTARSGAGIPYPLRAGRGMEPEVVVAGLVADGLRQAGVSVASSGGAPLRVTLAKLWADGYAGRYEMWLTLELALTAPDGAVTWSRSVEGKGGVTVQWSERELDKGYRRALEDALAKVAEAGRDPVFRTALGGAAPRGAAGQGPVRVASAGAQDDRPPPSPTTAAPGPQPPGQQIPWAEVTRHVDQRLVVEKTNGTWIVGVLMGMEANTLVLQKPDGRLLTVVRSDVRLVRVAR
jgi:hypothetical protein